MRGHHIHKRIWTPVSMKTRDNVRSRINHIYTYVRSYARHIHKRIWTPVSMKTRDNVRSRINHIYTYVRSYARRRSVFT